jgi:hypothetical protein
MVRRQVGTHDEAFFEIAGRRGIDRLRPERLVSAKAIRAVDVDRVLLIDIQGEEGSRVGEMRGDQGRGDAVVDDEKCADVTTRGAYLACFVPAPERVRRERFREIDGGKR